MGTTGNQNSWTPYDYRDCSLGICSIYCPQFCYFVFPPPPPDYGGGGGDVSPFTPLIIAVIGVLASAFILVSYYTIVTRYCRRRGDPDAESEEGLARGQWHAAAAGLEEAAIKAITVCEYREGEGLIEGTECAVCLSEFKEEERLRLLPKCSHAFHLPCIDTWLKSHSTCPLCRAAVAASPPPPPPPPPRLSADPYEFQRPSDLVVVVEERELNCLVVVGDAKAGGLRRSVSLPSSERRVTAEMVRCQSWRITGEESSIRIHEERQ